jgi:hypothetical protein
MAGRYRLHTNVQARAVFLPVIPGRAKREPGMTNHEAACAFYRQRRFSSATPLDSFRVRAQDRSYTNKRRRL